MSSSDGHCPNPPGFSPSPKQDPNAEVLAEHAQSIRNLSKRVIADVIEIGRRLSECKKLLGHGNWLPWIEREFRWSERTARNFISAFEFSQSKSANIADFGIEVSSIYLLASPSTPEKGREEVLRRAEAGEQMPYAKVKRIVDGAREDDETATPIAKSHFRVKDVAKAIGGDFARLPPVEQTKIIEKGPKDIHLAIADATTRQRWNPRYRELQDALDILDALAKRPMSKIIAAIPSEHAIATAKRVEGAKNFLAKINEKLALEKKVEKVTPCADDAASLAKLLTEARKINAKKFGRPSQTQVLETIWPDLNPAQIELLRSGKHGPEIKATTERLILAHDPTQETSQRVTVAVR